MKQIFAQITSLKRFTSKNLVFQTSIMNFLVKKILLLEEKLSQLMIAVVTRTETSIQENTIKL